MDAKAKGFGCSGRDLVVAITAEVVVAAGDAAANILNPTPKVMAASAKARLLRWTCIFKC